MLLKADASQLEWRTKVFLSQDPVALREIQNNEDLHSDNQKFFQLPNRTIAKNFLYRMIFADAFGERGYSSPAYAYANDPDFCHVSSSVRYWEEVVGRFFQKYPTIFNHGVSSIRTASETGLLINPSGRFYKFAPFQYPSGDWDWPRPNILNYPVQGLAADFMILARKIAWRTIPRSPEILFISTVHDDIELDCANDPVLIAHVGHCLEKAFSSVPAEFERLFGVKVNVPLAAEIKVGMCLHEDSMVSLQKYLDNPACVVI